MPTWLEWTLLAVGAWTLLSTTFGFSLARFLGAVESSSASAYGAGAPPISDTSSQTAAPGVPTAGPRRRRVLVVDDDAALRRLLRTTLATDDFDVEEVGSAEEARKVARLWRPSVVLLDVSLPGMDGLTFCAELAREVREALVILVTGEDISRTAARMAGAKALLRKPFSPLELLTLIDRLTGEAARSVPIPPQTEDEQLLIYARDLGRIASVERAQRELLQRAYRETAGALADAVEARDRGTGLHAQRVQQYALMLAEAVDPTLLRDPSLEYGFLLHDVGKIGVSDQILLKPGPLSQEERHEVQLHPTIGAQILDDIAMLRGAGLDIVRNHHERWDGAGYPNGLSGNEIPLGARVFALGDTLDAMTSDRPYRDALDWDAAVEEILAQSGRQFDPSVVQAFAAHESRLRQIYENLSLVA